jgi:pilus assembly protein CpaF
VLAALNTGHEGGCATLHVNAAADVPARLEALAALAGMDGQAVAAQAASALDAVLHLRRTGGRRLLAEVAVVERAADGALRVTAAMTRDASGRVALGAGWPVLSERIGTGAVPGEACA